jgi:hypothetical protein
LSTKIYYYVKILFEKLMSTKIYYYVKILFEKLTPVILATGGSAWASSSGDPILKKKHQKKGLVEWLKL